MRSLAFMASLLLALCCFFTNYICGVAAIPAVPLDSAMFVGSADGKISKFLGIPYARPPYASFQTVLSAAWSYLVSDRVGNLRFHKPLPLESYTGVHTASEFGASCPQQGFQKPLEIPPEVDMQVMSKIVNIVTNVSATSQSEDCKQIPFSFGSPY